MVLAQSGPASEKDRCIFARHDVDRVLNHAIDKKIHIGLRAIGRAKRDARTRRQVLAYSRSPSATQFTPRIQHNEDSFPNTDKLCRVMLEQGLLKERALPPAFRGTTIQTRRLPPLAGAQTACCRLHRSKDKACVLDGPNCRSVWRNTPRHIGIKAVAGRPRNVALGEPEFVALAIKNH